MNYLLIWLSIFISSVISVLTSNSNDKYRLELDELKKANYELKQAHYDLKTEFNHTKIELKKVHEELESIKKLIIETHMNKENKIEEAKLINEFSTNSVNKLESDKHISIRSRPESTTNISIASPWIPINHAVIYRANFTSHNVTTIPIEEFIPKSAIKVKLFVYLISGTCTNNNDAHISLWTNYGGQKQINNIFSRSTHHYAFSSNSDNMEFDIGIDRNIYIRSWYDWECSNFHFTIEMLAYKE